MTNNGKITAPVTTTDIGMTLGTSSRNVAGLCQSKLVNRWSKNKPVIYDSVEKLTDAQRKLVNYGFDMNYASDISLSNLFTKAQENPEWLYLLPENGDSHRMLDFNGYNHNAVEPFSYRSFPTVIETVNDSASLEFRILKNSNAEIEMTDLAYFDGHQSSFRYGIAIHKQGASSSDINIYTGPTIADADNEIIINVNFPSTGTWEILFVATRETTVTPINIDSVYMPLGYHVVEVDKKTEYAEVRITSSYNLELTSDGIIRGFHPVNLSVTARTSTFSECTGRFILNVYCYDTSNRLIGNFVVDDDQGSANFTYYGTATKTYSLDFLYGSPIAISAYDPSIDLFSVNRVELIPEIKLVSGNNSFIFNTEYKWDAVKS